MLHGRPAQFDPESGAGDEDRTRAWTGQKRRKHEGPSLTPSSARATGWTPSNSPHELADQDNYEVGEEDFGKYLMALSSRPPPTTIVGPRMEDEQQRKVDERLALYRIRAFKMRQGVSIDELDDMTLRKEYSPEVLEENYYFSDYDHVGTIDWCFDPDLSLRSSASDYHRLVLKNGDGRKYLDWQKYCSWFTTYEMDEEYLKYFEEISKKIKWIKRYLKFERRSPEDHIFNMRFDYFEREENEALVFEIWKRVAKQKITFIQALSQMQQQNVFPQLEKCIQFVLDNSSRRTHLQSTYDTCVEGISDETPEDEGRELIRMAVWNKIYKQKTWSEYITRKIEIAKHIGLDLQATCIRA